MSLSPETFSIQSRFARYCRDGEPVELPGVIPGRMDHYRRLITAILFENLEAAFPITHQFAASETWEAMVHHFFSSHRCQSYQVWTIAGEFRDFAARQNFAEVYDIPCLNDLLTFEWEEMCVYNMEDLEAEPYRREGVFLEDELVFHPEFKLIPLCYPVHLYEPAQATLKRGSYFVLLFREQDSGNVQFLDLSLWPAIVTEQLAEKKIHLKNLLDLAPQLFGAIDPEHIEIETIRFLEALRQKKFLLGFKDKTH